jgi:curved DNA-binding protein CbpA
MPVSTSKTSSATVHADDFYERLEVARTASREEIKHAYLRLVRRYPPERAPEEFKRIREAYETLSDPRTRHEYDERPDPLVEGWLAVAVHAMREEQYGEAERYLKQVLIQLPTLSFARNMLGLCFLYQGEAENAIAQYERLLQSGDAPAAWYGNAGAAYHMARRHADAERALLQAIVRSEGVAVDYYMELADVYLEQAQWHEAKQLLERAIQADAKVDFDDLRFYTKMLEVNLQHGQVGALKMTLGHISEIAREPDQKSYAAWKLGVLAQELVEQHDFESSVAVAVTACNLAPEDHDYRGLERIGRNLSHGQLAEALALVSTHRSFAPGGWLEGLRPSVEQYCRELLAVATTAELPDGATSDQRPTRVWRSTVESSPTRFLPQHEWQGKIFVGLAYFYALIASLGALAYCAEAVTRKSEDWIGVLAYQVGTAALAAAVGRGVWRFKKWACWFALISQGLVTLGVLGILLDSQNEGSEKLFAILWLPITLSLTPYLWRRRHVFS